MRKTWEWLLGIVESFLVKSVGKIKVAGHMSLGLMVKEI
jgi:hypothetical protein